MKSSGATSLNDCSPRLKPVRFSKVSLRRGASLIELLAVIALTSVLMGAIGLFFQKLFRAEATTRNEMQVTRTLQRLEENFRSDVRACESFVLAAPTNTLSLKITNERTIEYQCRGTIIERRVMKAGVQNPVRRDIHTMPECLTQLRLLDPSPLQGAVLIIRRPVPVLMTVPPSQKQYWTVEIRGTSRATRLPAPVQLSTIARP